MVGHPHAELMAQYAEDAKSNDRPYSLWEYQRGNMWIGLETHPSWSTNIKYRHKRDVIKIGEYEFPKPLSEKPKLNKRYWFVSTDEIVGFCASQDFWEDTLLDNRRLRSGIVHIDKEDAEEHAEILNKIHQVK